MEQRKLINHHELAEILAVSEQAVWRLARLGRIPSIRLGRSYRFNPDVVLKALEGKSQPEVTAK
jgi:excisionase family DNA binding protein